MFQKSFIVSMFMFWALTSLSAPQPWVEHKPGGDTLCARGDEFSFFHKQGSSEKIIIDFIGGGACWNSHTCRPGSSTFFDNVEIIRQEQKKGLSGIYDKNPDKNPFHDWTHVVVPYCTGDIHWGLNDKSYKQRNGDEFVLHHRGAANAQTVIQWVKDNYDPKNVLVTGCSAGAYGSAYWTPFIQQQMPGARLTQFGDSGGGIIPSEFFIHLNQNWQAHLNAPDWVPGLDPSSIDWNTMNLNNFYKRVLDAHPGLMMSQFHHDQDEVQKFFYELMFGNPDNWPQLLKDAMFDLDRHRQFRSVVKAGQEHCILPESEFFDVGPNQKSVAQWLYDYVHRKDSTPGPVYFK